MRGAFLRAVAQIADARAGVVGHVLDLVDQPTGLLRPALADVRRLLRDGVPRTAARAPALPQDLLAAPRLEAAFIAALEAAALVVEPRLPELVVATSHPD